MHIALIAHDAKKDLMVLLARDFAPFLSRCHVMATGTTGSRLIAEAGIEVERLLSGPLGGDLQRIDQVVLHPRLPIAERVVGGIGGGRGIHG